jgi:OOP family OmpA-OmpF porin
MDLRFSQFEILTAAGAFFLCLAFICVFNEASDIQDDVGIRAQGEAREHGLYWAGVEALGQRVRLTGAAPSDAQRLHAAAAVAALPGVTSVQNEIEVLGPDGACQRQMDSALAELGVTFKTGRAEIGDSSYPLIAELARTMGACATPIEIAVHTDSLGDAAVNLKLSQRRADAVRKALVQRGVRPDRLVAAGYGETQPVASNARESGRRENRRVEFRVVGGTA